MINLQLNYYSVTHIVLNFTMCHNRHMSCVLRFSALFWCVNRVAKKMPTQAHLVSTQLSYVFILEIDKPGGRNAGGRGSVARDYPLLATICHYLLKKKRQSEFKERERIKG